MEASTAMDRLAMRVRPEGSPVMEQNWEQLLFLHWPVPVELLRAHIPASLEIDTFEGTAWVGITPFKLSGLRLLSAPPIPGLSAFNEINVRTYVHHQGVPGIWFFSLDASRLLPALAARIFFMLPYYSADIEFSQLAGDLAVNMKRDLRPDIRFKARWRPGSLLRAPDVESLAFFLVERYCFFAELGGRLSFTRVYHHPWILREATVQGCESTLVGAAGLPEPAGDPLIHFSDGVQVQVWPPKEL